MVDRADLAQVQAEYDRCPDEPFGQELYGRYKATRRTLKDALDLLAVAIDEREKETKRAAAEEKLEERE